MSERLQKVMDSAYKCMQASNHCFDACLNEDNVDMLTECIRLDRETADICAAVLSFSGREGSLQNDLVALCGTICQANGKECEQHDMDHCQKCAEVSFECAEACRSYVNA